MTLLDAYAIYARLKKEMNNLRGLPVAGFLKLYDVLTITLDKMQFEVSVYVTRKK